jgi:hypothetical protein
MDCGLNENGDSAQMEDCTQNIAHDSAASDKYITARPRNTCSRMVT